jgi:methyltransferase (TIGR00027 family)
VSDDAIIGDVSDTAFWVAYYRAKENERAKPLFHDPFAQALIGTRGKALAEAMPKIGRYTEWTVIARTVIIDRFIEQAIQEGVDAIINVGAGLDTRPYRMNLPEDLPWIEVDYANIIEHKNRVLKFEKPKCQLTFVALDLANTEQQKEFFISAVPDAKKVLILTEGVIPYLSPDQVSVLAQNLLAQERFTYWITEYFHPQVYRYLKDTAHRAKMKNAPFKFFPDEWYAFFAKFGWMEKETRYIGEIATEFKRKMPMPKIAELTMWLLPKKVKEHARRMSGFVIFKRQIQIK